MARTFYHNTGGNTSASNFNIVRIYPNKEDLMNNRATDGVYPGSYVLVDYDKDINPAVYDSENDVWNFDTSFAYKEGWAAPEDQYYRPSDENHYLLSAVDPAQNNGEYIYYLYSNEYSDDIGISAGTVIFKRTQNENYDVTNPKTKFHYDFYVCVGAAQTKVSGENPQNAYADFRELSSTEQYFNEETGELFTVSSSYTENYLRDSNHGAKDIGRGYDGTVWQKVIVDGNQRYVQIAELNSAVPTFNFNMVPPKEEGVSPHINYQVSSNMYYEMYDSPHLGFRVKKADPDPTTSTDTAQYPSEEGSDLAIYWNEDGFKKNQIGYDNDYEHNLIKVAKTGKSRRDVETPENPNPIPYKDEQTGQIITPGTTEDIQELSIILPGLGNAMSDIWDIVYGDKDANRVKYTNFHPNDTYDEKTRETDITWYNANASELEKTKGLRLVDYNITSDGTYKYSSDEVESLAGCINSVHDLMGMIIYNGNDSNPPISLTNSIQLEEASSNYIYYIGNRFYRKGVKTNYRSTFDIDDLYQPINVINYDSNDKYFSKDLTNFIRLTAEEPNLDVTYYQFANESEDMARVTGTFTDYRESTYYYVTGSGDTQTVILEDARRPRDGVNYYGMEFERGYIAFYDPLKYYLPEDPSQPISEDNRVHPQEETPQRGVRYYYPYKYSIIDEQTHTVKNVDAYQGILGEELTVFQAWTYFIKTIETDDSDPEHPKQIVKYKLITRDTVPFYSEIPGAGEIVNLKFEVWTRTDLSNKLNFYDANRYYYRLPESAGDNDIYDYYLDSNATKTNNRIYYELVNEPVKVDRFYQQNKFYYLYEGNYELDSSENYTSGRNYYQKLNLYVVDDLTNLYRIGSEWNQNLGIDNVELGTYDPAYGSAKWNNFDTTNDDPPKPPTLISGTKIGLKEEEAEWYELVGFARNLNTIHGMLMKLNVLMNTDDSLSRNTETVQGCINRINDIIDLFGGLYPDDLLMADKNGRVVTGSVSGDTWTTLATSGKYEQRENPSTHQIENVYVGPQLQVSHLGQSSTKTTSTTDLNSTNGNTVALLNITTDNKGHVTAEHTTTVTLPNSYGTISGDSGSVFATDSTDTLTIAGDNSLISTSAANSTLTITHETHTVTPDNSPSATLSSTSTIPFIVVHQYGYDGAGHITSETNTTVSGVAGYGVVTGDAGAGASATASLDTLSITGDTWIGTSAANKNVTISHKAPTVVEPEPSSSLTPVFGGSFSITDWHYDSTGHKDGASSHTITIPQGSLVDQTTEQSSFANVITGINFTPLSGQIGYTHQNASTLLLTGYNSAHNIISANGTIGDAFASIEGKFNTLENSILGNANDIDALETAVNTINNTTIPNIVNTTIPNAVDGAVRDLVNGATTAFDTFKEIEDWINDGNSGAASIITRVGALETAIGSLNGSGEGSISSQLSNYVLKSEASGYDDILTITSAQTTYQTKLTAGTDYVQPATLASYLTSADAGTTYQPIGNYIETSDTFTYDNSDPLNPVEMTVAQLVAYVKTLEDRIAILEGGGGGGGNEPEPQTPVTPDVVIEFTQGVGSTTADFTDVLTNINGDNDLTYSVVVDNVELNLDETTPVEIQQDNGNDIIVVNLDDATYEKVVWANDGNDSFTLVPIQIEP